MTDRAHEFERDLQIWAQVVLRPVGPSIEVSLGTEPIQPIDIRPVSRINRRVVRYKPPLTDYECSWSKYLDANQIINQWAIANPEMAAQEMLRLNAES